MDLEPSGQLPAPVDALETVKYQEILDHTRNGQTRYQELRDDLNIKEDELDRRLMELAKQGDVSLVAVGDVLSVQSHHSHGESS